MLVLYNIKRSSWLSQFTNLDHLLWAMSYERWPQCINKWPALKRYVLNRAGIREQFAICDGKAYVPRWARLGKGKADFIHVYSECIHVCHDIMYNEAVNCVVQHISTNPYPLSSLWINHFLSNIWVNIPYRFKILVYSCVMPYHWVQ